MAFAVRPIIILKNGSFSKKWRPYNRHRSSRSLVFMSSTDGCIESPPSLVDMERIMERVGTFKFVCNRDVVECCRNPGIFILKISTAVIALDIAKPAAFEFNLLSSPVLEKLLHIANIFIQIPLTRNPDLASRNWLIRLRPIAGPITHEFPYSGF